MATNPGRPGAASRTRHARSRNTGGLAAICLSTLLVGIGAGASHAAPKTTATYYHSFGHAADVEVGKGGRVIVSLGQVAKPIGLQLFDSTNGFSNPCGGTNIINLTALGIGITSAFGIDQFPDRPKQAGTNKVSIGVAVETKGVEFVRADLRDCSVDGDVQVQQYPMTNPPPPKNGSPGTFGLATTLDGYFAFVANEYGVADTSPDHNLNQGGTVGIVSVKRDQRGRFTGATQQVGPIGYIYVPGANTIPGVTMSHDGKRLYVVNEDAVPYKPIHYGGHAFNNPTNMQNSPLVSEQCVNEFGSSNGYSLNGVLTVIDVDKAVAGQGQAAIIRRIAAGCSPVRVVETADGKYIYVAARGGNPGQVGSDPPPGSIGRVAVFNVHKLTSHRVRKANASVVRVFSSRGTAPVGMTLFNDDQLLAVANSNRFTSGEGNTNVAIFDVSNPVAPKREVICRSGDLFAFPRGITAEGLDLYVANFGSLPDKYNVDGALQVINYVPGARGCEVGPYPAD